MRCADCDAPIKKAVRCEDCLEEVAETPDWLEIEFDWPTDLLAAVAALVPGEPAVCLCAEPGCGQLSRCRGLCKTHYNRWYYGPDGPGYGKTRNGAPDKRRERNRMQTRRRRARVSDPRAEDIYIDVVGDRDGWRCFCRRKVNPAKNYPHPLSPSIDHIEPLSLGGLHTYANVRIAHLRCNTARSNRGGNEQLALIG